MALSDVRDAVAAWGGGVQEAHKVVLGEYRRQSPEEVVSRVRLEVLMLVWIRVRLRSLFVLILLLEVAEPLDPECMSLIALVWALFLDCSRIDTPPSQLSFASRRALDYG